VHQFTTFTTPPDLQKAVAYGLSKDDSYFKGLAADLQARRDRLAAACVSLGLKVLPCRGTYFLTVDISPLGLEGDDAALARRLTVEAGLATVPVSAFYVSDAPSSYLRLCFCKRDSVLDDAAERLGGWLRASRRNAA
jgi:aspartate/methionine/tyrosine aminotransferase